MGTPETAIPVDWSAKAKAVLDAAEAHLRQRSPSAASFQPGAVLGIALFAMVGYRMPDAKDPDPVAEIIKEAPWWQRRQVRWELFYLIAAAADITVFISVSPQACSEIRGALNIEMRKHLGKERFERLLQREVAYAEAFRQEEKIAGRIGSQFMEFCRRSPCAVTGVLVEEVFYEMFEMVSHLLAAARKVGRGVE